MVNQHALASGVHRAAALLLLFLGLMAASVAQPPRVCVTCHRQVPQGYLIDNKFYCLDHWQQALPKCSICSQPMQGTYHVHGPKASPICATCVLLPPCFVCGLPSDTQRGSKLLPDGRHLCTIHQADALFSAARASELFHRAVSETEKTFGARLRLKVPVKSVVLVDIPKMQALTGNHFSQERLIKGRLLGLTSLTLKQQGANRWTEPAVVHILNALPTTRFLTVSTHEYAHAWHAENHKDYNATSALVREGFAEWIAYKVSEREHRTEEMAILLNPQGEVYYAGLQKFLALERQIGTKATLERALTLTEI